MSAKLIIVRHAQATGNLEGRFQARVDTDITPLGRAQLERLTSRLEKEHIDAVYCSPLLRTRLTAQACVGTRDLPLVIDDRLIEIDAGPMDGLRWDELYERFPEQMTVWKEQPHLFHPPHGESMAQVRSRISEAVTDISARHGNGTVVVVTHGVVVRNLMCWAKGLPHERLIEMNRWSNTGVGIIEMTDGKPKVLLENDDSHLAGLEA